MRGAETKQATMLSLLSPEQRVPKDHPLRRIKQLADAALSELSPVFDEMYAAKGRPSVPPERLLKGSLLMAFYSVRSERLFCEQLDYNLMFRWFLDMAQARRGREIFRGGRRAGAERGSDERRPFHRRWNAD